MRSKSARSRKIMQTIFRNQRELSDTYSPRPMNCRCPLSLLKIPLLPNRQSTPPRIPQHPFKYPPTHKIISVITIALSFRAPRDMLFGRVAEHPLFAREVEGSTRQTCTLFLPKGTLFLPTKKQARVRFPLGTAGSSEQGS